MRIGVLGNEGSWYVNEICSCAAARGHQAFGLQFQQLVAGVTGGQRTYRFGDIDATELDAVIVRTMPPGSLEQVVSRMDVLAGIADLGVCVVNSPKSVECAVDKYLTTQRLAAAGLPVPDTIVCEDSEAALDAFERLGGDVVVKPLFGAEGRGMLRVDHPDLALRTFRTLERINATLYLQKFIDGVGEDLRLLLLDGELVASMKRTARPGDFRANAAQLGSSQPWTPTDFEISLACSAAAVTGCVFSGVDLMYNERKEPVVIEVNAVPGWRTIQKTCQVDVCNRFICWLESDLLTRSN